MFAAVALAGAFADQLHCLVTPAFLGNVAMAYRRFDVPDEAQIREMLDRCNRSVTPRHVC